MKIQYTSDKTGSLQETEGSDNRLNVSSRADSRAYYNSRDVGRSFSFIFDHQDAAAGEFSAYWKNSSKDQVLVISTADLNTVQNARVKMHFVVGTPAGGTSVTPVNTNRESSKSADSVAIEGASGAAITGLSSAGVVDFESVPANGQSTMHAGDLIRLGQDDAIALEYDEGTTGDFYGVIRGYFE